MQGTAWDREADLLVLGAGAGGMTAALVGALEGLDVLVCEASSQVGGTTSTSAGTLWIPGNTQSLRAGFTDSADLARRYVNALDHGPRDGALRDAFYATGPAVIDYLEARSQVQFVPCGKHPDYFDRDGAAVTGRALAPRAFDGRALGADFARVRPPIPEFMVFGGMMVGKDDIPKLVNRFKSPGNFWHAVKLFARYLADRLRYPRGTRIVMGNALVARLFASLRDNQVPILFGAALEDLIVQDGRVAGALVKTQEGTMRVKARSGVVLATGGFAHHTRMREAFMPLPTPRHSLACGTNQGDGIAIARRIGAKVEPERHGSGAFWTPASITHRPDGSTGLYPHLSLDRAKPGLIAVNQAGQRFVNEANSYHAFVEAMYESHRSSPTMPAWLVCNADFVRRYGLGAIHPGSSKLGPHVKSGYLVMADSLKELAAKTGVDPRGLEAEVARYNSFAVHGVDPAFGKGTSELNRFNGDPLRGGANPCIATIDKGPYCAVAVWPAEIACSTGLVTNADGQVLGESEPIAGLYACGNDMASIMSGTYPGPGTTLGPALVFGWRVAMHAKWQHAGQSAEQNASARD